MPANTGVAADVVIGQKDFLSRAPNSGKGAKFTRGRKWKLIFKEKLKSHHYWGKVDFHGYINRNEVQKILANSSVGIVTLHPTNAYIESLPVKMFEYMAAGIPVIASNFPLWKEIVEGNNCGICVDPLDPKEIGGAIQYLIDNPKESEKMGKNGLRAAINTYNWSLQEKKLFSFYKQTLNTQSIKS